MASQRVISGSELCEGILIDSWLFAIVPWAHGGMLRCTWLRLLRWIPSLPVATARVACNCAGASILNRSTTTKVYSHERQDAKPSLSKVSKAPLSGLSPHCGMPMDSYHTITV